MEQNNKQDLKIRLDDLQYEGLMLYQYPDLYCFTSDAVLLANLCRVKKGDIVVDFGTGSGIIAVLLAKKTLCEKVYGVEKQSIMCSLAMRNAEYNNLQEKIEIINEDIQNIAHVLRKESVNVVVCNPPYFKEGSGDKREREEIALSRHESSCNLEGIIKSASDILKYGGALYMVHKVERMAEVLTSMSNNNLEPKNIKLIRPKASKGADVFIVEGRKYGKSGLKIEDIIVYNEDGSMTEKAQKLYGKQ